MAECAVSGEGGANMNFHVLIVATRAYSQFCPRDDIATARSGCPCSSRPSIQVPLTGPDGLRRGALCPPEGLLSY